MASAALLLHRSCTGGKTEDFVAAAQLLHKSQQQVKVPTFLVPATQKVWADVYALPVPGCEGRTAAQIFSDAGCEAPASPSCAACLGGAPSARPACLIFLPCHALKLSRELHAVLGLNPDFNASRGPTRYIRADE